MEKFNQIKYIQQYNKEHYSTFKVSLLKEEMEELNYILKERNMTKADFLRVAIKNLKINKKKSEK